MTARKLSGATERPLSQEFLHAARYYLGGRRGLLILGGVALALGLTLNWSTLAAAGIAPLLLGVAPCALMCVLGLCMNRTSGKACSSETMTGDLPAVPPAGDHPAAVADARAEPNGEGP